MSARDRLVYAVIDLVRRHGVAGTGVAEILKHGHVSRGSIYLNFPDGKEGLVAEATRVADEFIDGQIATYVELATPHDALEAFIAEWKNVVAGSDFAAGCPIAAAGLSRSSTPAIADIAGDAFARWQARLAASLQGHGLAESTAMTLSNTILAAVEGAVVMAVAQKSVTALDDVGAQLAVLIEHHLAATGR